MGVERPLWLDEEVEIRALLHVALDRFDRQRGVDRQRRIHLTALEQLPSLARADAAADQTWALMEELERRGVLSIRRAARSPYDVDWLAAKIAFSPEAEGTLRDWLSRDWSAPAKSIWRDAIEKHSESFHDAGAALLSQRIVIENRTALEVVSALAAAAKLTAPMTLRQLSATVFWGNSKILDDRGELVAALLPHLEIRDRTLVMAVHLPRECRGVLFIENQDTYTNAAAGMPAESRELALVFAAGFRGSAARVRSRPGSLMHYAGPGLSEFAVRFDAWWYEGGTALGPCWFWGDLDFAGMQILKALRSRFEGLCAWPAGYEPMLARLQTTGGYGTTRSDDPRGQIDPGLTGCAYADATLLPAIRRYGQTDQESMA
jgi:Uncharacterized protein conserved in bacteria C-term(DUF2220)